MKFPDWISCFFGLTKSRKNKYIVGVKKGPLRILATVLLVLTLLNLSGLTATAGTLIAAASANSCCDHGCDEPPAAGPCSTPDCPCFSCIAMIVVPALSVQRDLTERLLPLAVPKRHHLSAYIRSIEYPPEAT